MAHRDRLAALQELQEQGLPLQLPEPTTPSGRIYRDIHGLGNLYDSKGSVASPELIAANVGVLYTHNLEATLSRQLATVDAVISQHLAIAAGATATNTFSFAEDHRIVSWNLTVVTPGLANFGHSELSMRPFGDPSLVTIGQWDATGVPAAFPAAVGYQGTPVVPLIAPPAPLFGKAATDYQWIVTNGGAGLVTVDLRMAVVLQVEGTRVAG